MFSSKAFKLENIISEYSVPSYLSDDTKFEILKLINALNNDIINKQNKCTPYRCNNKEYQRTSPGADKGKK